MAHLEDVRPDLVLPVSALHLHGLEDPGGEAVVVHAAAGLQGGDHDRGLGDQVHT